jgi:hypothetical protein
MSKEAAFETQSLKLFSAKIVHSLPEPGRGQSIRCHKNYKEKDTLSSHLVWTDKPQSLHVFPCLLKPHIDDWAT